MIMAKITAWISERGSDAVRDLVGLLGVALVGYGAGEIYRPAGFIVLGLLVIAGCYMSARIRR